MDDYYQDKKGRSDDRERKSIAKDMSEADPAIYDGHWGSSEWYEAMMRAHSKRTEKVRRDTCGDQDIGSYSVDNVIEEVPIATVPILKDQEVVSEEGDRSATDRPKKKKKKEKKREDTRHIDRRSAIGPRDLSMSVMGGTPMRRSEKRELDIDSVVKTLKEEHTFICIAGRKLFAFTGKIFEDITDKNHAAAIFKEFLSEETNRLIRDYTEIYNQLLSDKDIWYNSMEEIRKNRDVIVFESGTYAVNEQIFYENKFWEEDHVFFMIRLAYDPEDTSGKEDVDQFMDTFCGGDPRRKRLFKEIVSYCLSNYDNKKAIFYFLGVPNSGKSSVCRFLEIAVGSDAYISVAVKQLNSRFVSGDLEGIKVCADEDVAIRTPLRSDDVSMIKKISSSDKIRTDAKYQRPGQLHPECRLVWAGNGMLTFETSEDLQPLIDRMIIFPLDRAIPEERRDPNIVDKLIVGRNYMISESLKALHDLVERDFQFTKVVQTEEYFTARNLASGIEAFVEDCCILDKDSRESSSTLYGAYIRFCEDNPGYKSKSINQFSSYIEDKYGLQPFNDGRIRGKRGIRLCDHLRTDAVD